MFTYPILAERTTGAWASPTITAFLLCDPLIAILEPVLPARIAVDVATW